MTAVAPESQPRPRRLTLTEIWGLDEVESTSKQIERLAVRVDELDQRVDHLLRGRSGAGHLAGEVARAAVHGVSDKAVDLFLKGHRLTVALARRARKWSA